MINLTHKTDGTIINWGTSVKNPNSEGIVFLENVTLPEDFNGVNYIYLDGFVQIQEEI